MTTAIQTPFNAATTPMWRRDVVVSVVNALAIRSCASVAAKHGKARKQSREVDL